MYGQFVTYRIATKMNTTVVESVLTMVMMMMMMMMVLCPKAGSLAFTPPGNEMSEVVSCCLPHT